MAQESGFFTAEELADGSYDRVYTAEQFAYYFSKFIGNGIYINPATQLQVSQSATIDMSINVSIGDAYINGYWFSNTAIENKQIAVASGALDRIDLVVLRWTKATRKITIEIVTGTPAADAQMPTLQRDENAYELCLAKIMVNRAVTQITNTLIVDTRQNSQLCGYVKGVIDQIDTTNLFQQFTAAFNDFYNSGTAQFDDWVEQKQTEYDTFINEKYIEFITWFEDVKSQLTEDVVGNIMSQLSEMKSTLTKHKNSFAAVEGLTIPIASWEAVSTPFVGFRYTEVNAFQAYNTVTDNGTYSGPLLANVVFDMASVEEANQSGVSGGFEIEDNGNLNLYAKKKPTKELTYNFFIQRQN